jgi:hypothetical protein
VLSHAVVAWIVIGFGGVGLLRARSSTSGPDLAMASHHSPAHQQGEATVAANPIKKTTTPGHLLPWSRRWLVQVSLADYVSP